MDDPIVQITTITGPIPGEPIDTWFERLVSTIRKDMPKEVTEGLKDEAEAMSLCFAIAVHACRGLIIERMRRSASCN